MNDRIPCYVSYRRRNGVRPEYLQRLARTCPDDIELKIDDGEIQPGDDFTVFMEELMAAPHLLLVLSEDYFQSEHCVAELVGATQHRSSLAGVAFVVKEDDWVLDKDSPQEFREYWSQQANREGLLEEERQRYERFVEHTERLFDALRSIAMEAHGPDEFLDDTEKLWRFIRKRHRILQKANGASIDPSIDPTGNPEYQSYLRLIENEIQNGLRVAPELRKAVAGKLTTNPGNADMLARSLVQTDQEFGSPIGDLFQAIEQALMNTSDEARRLVRESAVSCYFALLRKTVDHTCLKRFEDQRFIRLLEKSEHAAEFVMAALQYRRLRYAPDGRPEGDLGFSRVEWGTATKHQLNGLLTYVWNQMAGCVGWPLKKTDTPLTEDERDQLNAEICQSRYDGEGKFLSFIDGTDFGYIFSDALRKELEDALPCLDMVSLGASDGTRVFILTNVGSPGPYLTSRIRKLFQLLSRYP